MAHVQDMAEKKLSTTIETADGAGSPTRVWVKTLALGAIAALIAMGSGGASVAFGAGLGALAAGFYGVNFLRSHLNRLGNLERIFDSSVAKMATIRLIVVVAGGIGAYALGKPAAVAYLASFAVCFAVIVISEIPRASKQLRARGLIG